MNTGHYCCGTERIYVVDSVYDASAIGILPEGFTEDNHLMNSTLKIVRPKIVERYQNLIDYLYTPEAKDVCNAKNMSIINDMGFNGN